MEIYNEQSVSETNSEEKDLLEQFENSKEIDFNGKLFKVIDIAPKELKTKIPTLMIPGFSATPEALKDAILRIAEKGRRVISAEAPHGID
ncbi:MAG: hypothetical protein WCX88_00220, partial [Patescibacteria group bacterium]